MKSYQDLISDYKLGKKTKSELLELIKPLKNDLIVVSELLNDSIQNLTFIKDKIYLSYHGIILNVNLHQDRDLAFDMLFLGDYENEIFTLMGRLLDKESVFIDVGANIGIHTLYALKSLECKKVLSFEPVIDSIRILENNLSLNSVDFTKVETYNYALSNRDSDDTIFYVDLNNSMASSFVRLIDNHNHIDTVISTRKFDSLNLKLSRIDLLKIDTEGSELFVIEGFIETIRLHKPLIIVEILRKWCEKNHYKPQDIIDLIGNDYLLFEIFKNKIVQIEEIDELTSSTNFLFLPKEKLNRFPFLKFGKENNI